MCTHFLSQVQIRLGQDPPNLTFSFCDFKVPYIKALLQSPYLDLFAQTIFQSTSHHITQLSFSYNRVCSTSLLNVTEMLATCLDGLQIILLKILLQTVKKYILGLNGILIFSGFFQIFKLRCLTIFKTTNIILFLWKITGIWFYQ